MSAAFTPAAETIAAWTLICLAAICLLVHYARRADQRLQQTIDAVLAVEAADHGELSRAEIELGLGAGYWGDWDAADDKAEDLADRDRRDVR